MENMTEKVRAVLEKIRYITVASITPDGNPWNSPVDARHDDNYNYIWNSSYDSQHSKNIASNNKIFIVVYDSTVPEGDGFGVYMEAEARELSEGPELENAIKVFYEKKNKEPSPASKFLAPSLRRMYIAVPKKIWINKYDKTRMPPDYREEIKL